jgi:hypothetical protein
VSKHVERTRRWAEAKRGALLRLRTRGSRRSELDTQCSGLCRPSSMTKFAGTWAVVSPPPNTRVGTYGGGLKIDDGVLLEVVAVAGGGDRNGHTLSGPVPEISDRAGSG